MVTRQVTHIENGHKASDTYRERSQGK